MNRIGEGADATWTQIYHSPCDHRSITWDDLLGIARLHWNWVKVQDDAYTSTATCIVAALMLPSTRGAVIFLSTIARGDRYTEMSDFGFYNAPAWHYHNRGSDELHAEKAAEYLFESSNYSQGIVSNMQYVLPDRDNPLKPHEVGCLGPHAQFSFRR